MCCIQWNDLAVHTMHKMGFLVFLWFFKGQEIVLWLLQKICVTNEQRMEFKFWNLKFKKTQKFG